MNGEFDVGDRHRELTVTAPATIEIAGTTYTLRKYTPKRRGESAGHGWVRQSTWGKDAHRSEVGAEAVNLIDEIVVLRAELEAFRLVNPPTTIEIAGTTHTVARRRQLVLDAVSVDEARTVREIVDAARYLPSRSVRSHLVSLVDDALIFRIEGSPLRFKRFPS